MLDVPEGFETKLNPRALLADQVIVALLMISSPVEPGEPVTEPRLVTGPFHWMSKLHFAGEDTGFSKRNSALGMSKKSVSARSVIAMCALPRPRLIESTVGFGTVQNNPPG